MTGVDVTCLISSMIATVKATTKDYNIVNDDKGLPATFHKAGRGLLYVKGALQTAKTQLNERCLAGNPQSAISLLEACNTKAKLSASIFKDVAQAPKTSRLESYKAAVQQQGRGKTVEVLTLGMMKDVCGLAENDTIKAEMEDQVTRLRDTIDKLSKMDPSLPNEGLGNTFNSCGDSHQFNALGGTQNNNTGNGNQFPGASFSGPVNFGKNS